MGFLDWLSRQSQMKVPTVLDGQMHRLDQIDRETRRLNRCRKNLEAGLGNQQNQIDELLTRQAEETERSLVDWVHQPEYYEARLSVLQNRQLGVRIQIADIGTELQKLRAERQSVIEAMNESRNE